MITASVGIGAAPSLCHIQPSASIFKNHTPTSSSVRMASLDARAPADSASIHASPGQKAVMLDMEVRMSRNEFKIHCCPERVPSTDSPIHVSYIHSDMIL